MDKCRICLKTKKRLLLINDSDGETTYLKMITSLANIKIEENNLFPNKICLNCERQLTKAYNFKLYIQQSHNKLNETLLKKVYFSDINDIKMKTKLEDFKTNLPIPLPEVFELNKNCISYNDIVITKICNDAKTDDYIAETNEHRNEDAGSDDYNSDNHMTNEFTHDSLKAVKKNINKKSNSVNAKNHNKICMKPIKPKVSRSIVLLQNAPEHVRAAINSKEKRPYKSRQDICPFCGKITKSLRSHIQVHKTGEKNYKCEICDKVFFSSTILRSHKRKHTSTKDYKCDHCTAAFISRQLLKLHMTIHAPEKNFSCNTCGKGFKRKSAMTRHMVIHNFGKKKIQCDQCDMSFHNNVALNNHMRVHTGERPYKCEICSQPYSYKHDFNRHCFKKHGVFLKRRSVYVMNEEVLARERVIMRDLLLRIQGITKDDKPLNPFEGPQAHLAFEQAVKALQSNQISVDL